MQSVHPDSTAVGNVEATPYDGVDDQGFQVSLITNANVSNGLSLVRWGLFLIKE